MGQVFELTIEPDEPSQVVRFELRDGGGAHLASHPAQLSQDANWQGLFDARSFVELYEGSLQLTDHPATAAELLERLGVFLGETVLGPEVTAKLWESIAQRTLLVRAPAGESDLAAALARVPWEIARPHAGTQPLVERNLSVRLLPPSTEPAAGELATIQPEGPLKVLLVFAEAPGSRPLAMRQEREALLDLFERVMPSRQLQVDILCNGVTRRRLHDSIQENGGYHLIHWSGHGHHDLLELYGEDGEPELLSGEGFHGLIQAAGGFVPQVVVLSACLSGTLTRIANREELEAALVRRPEEGSATSSRAATESASPPHAALDLSARPGYAGTALGLLAAGVPQVLAMRYAVGDAYARELACRFYQHLLADAAGHPADTALALARSDLLAAGEGSGLFGAVDHATPVLFGAARLRLAPRAGRSPALARSRPFPQPLLPGDSRELDRPRDLVGRGAELTRLATSWLSGEGPAVALVTGLGGLGKTALAAEAIHLWHRCFALTLAFQAKPEPLTTDGFYQQVDEKLALDSEVYRVKCEASPNARVHLPVTGHLTGEARYRRMRENLLEALRDEAVLLVLDNFETNLETVRGKDGYRAADPEWDRLLAHLARHLAGTGSRLLITSRHHLSVLAPERLSVGLPLGPLPMNEAVLYLQQVPALAQLAWGDEDGRALAYHLLAVSRGHPLILARLGALAGDREALRKALAAFESQGIAKALPTLFATAASPAERERERQYLEDVAAGSIDLLLERATPEARRLLWIVTLANEPVSEPLIAGVWSGRTVKEEQMEAFRTLAANADRLPQKMRELLASVPEEIRQKLEVDAGSAEPPPPPVQPLLAELVDAGLLTAEGDEGSRLYEFHELVRERAARWMAEHLEETVGWTEERSWVAYGERYVVSFRSNLASSRAGAGDLAIEAGRRALSYFVRARAFDTLGSFASALVTSTQDPSILNIIIAGLQSVVGQVPPGQARWRISTNLAGALDSAGKPDLALPLYAVAAQEAEVEKDWVDLGTIYQNWASALRRVGRLTDAKENFLRSAEAAKAAGSPRIDILASELEAARTAMMEGHAATVLPEIEARLEELRGWWQRHLAGERVPEAPGREFLSRLFVGALDIAGQAQLALEKWQACLDLLAEKEQVERELGAGAFSLARTRFNRYGPLLRLGKLAEAETVLQGCASAFRQAGDTARQATTLSALADLWDERHDRTQAIALERQALALRNRLPDPEDRGISHSNLQTYLERRSDVEEAARHGLAAFVYYVVSGHGQHLSVLMHNLRIRMNRAKAAGKTYELPRLDDLLARPEFDPLRRFLEERGASTAEVQAAVDQIVEQVRSS